MDMVMKAIREADEEMLSRYLDAILERRAELMKQMENHEAKMRLKGENG